MKNAFFPALQTLPKRMGQSIKSLHDELARSSCGDRGDGYAWQNNGANVLAVAHCDYVNLPKRYVRTGPIVMSPQLDDRLGVWVILDLLPRLIKTDILLTTDEEIGRSTAQFFNESRHCKQYNWVFSFDRRGTDAVTYDSHCMDNAVAEFFDLGFGSFSDISYIDQPGVNIGVGYHGEHTRDCYANLVDTYDQVRKFLQFYECNKDVTFHWVDDLNEFDDWDDWDDYDDYDELDLEYLSRLDQAC